MAPRTKARPTASESLEAKETFGGFIGEGENRVGVVFNAGDVVPADDPAVKEWPDKFRALDARRRPTIEQATAGPGEVRG